MILVDLNQVLLAGLMAQISPKNNNNTGFQEHLIRHMVLNILRNHVKNFKEYGEVILCCDNRKYWRKEYFPFYKAGRKKTREKSDLDWHQIFDTLAKLKQELKENFPYKVIDVEGAEADDIIGTLVPLYARSEKILILSSDGDFLQLQQYGSNVKQYNPILKKYIISENPLVELKEKIIRGDKGDGIPNMFSPADCFVREVKQKSITKVMLEKYLNENVINYGVTDTANFLRNSTLIDLSNIPNELKQRIINTYEETKPASRQKLLNYFIEHKLTILMDVIGDF